MSDIYSDSALYLQIKSMCRTKLIDGLEWLVAASHGLRVQTRKFTAAN